MKRSESLRTLASRLLAEIPNQYAEYEFDETMRALEICKADGGCATHSGNNIKSSIKL